MGKSYTQLSPIILFTYNRPVHTRQTVESLQKNFLAAESDLIVYSDCWKDNKSRPKVEETRQYLKTITGFNSVKIVERDRNFGLANNVIDGVTAIVNEYEKVIVIEDDIVSSPHMLKYFNDALNRYEDEEKVMHIGAYMFPIDIEGMPETFFFRLATSWGWATWKRAWQHFNPDIEELYRQFNAEKIHGFSIERTGNFWRIFQKFRKGDNDSWAIRWYASIFLKGGLGLHPAVSMVNNIGHDGSGTHSNATNTYFTKTAMQTISTFPSIIEENHIAYERIKHFFVTIKRPLFQIGIKFLQTKYKKLFK
jgi:hypothetical protein